MSGIDNAELYTVAPDEVVVTFTTEPGVEVTTRVGGHTVTTTGPYHHASVAGLDAATSYDLSVGDAASTELCPASVTTLLMPRGELRARFATVNDVHFGELVCGLLGTEEELGPVFSVADGDPPYPEVMNRGAIAELAAGDFDAVVVKGDLTAEGTEAEYQQFLAAYGELGARMRHVRGNHDADKIDTIATTGPFTIELSGVTPRGDRHRDPAPGERSRVARTAPLARRRGRRHVVGRCSCSGTIIRGIPRASERERALLRDQPR